MSQSVLRWGTWFAVAAMLLFGAARSGAQTTVAIDRVAGTGVYNPGGTIEITITFNKTGIGTVTQLGLTETIPAGWTYAGLVAGGSQPEIPPSGGAGGTINFAYLFPPLAFPATFTYRLNVDAASTGQQSIVGNAVYAVDGGALQDSATVTTDMSEGGAEGEGEGEGEGVGPDVVTFESRTIGGDTKYHAGGPIEVTVTLAYGGADPLATLGLEETIPPGWTYDGLVSGDAPPIAPAAGATDTLSFAYLVVPPLPVTFTYGLNVPVAESGTKPISGNGIYSTTGGQETTNTIVTNILEGTPISSEGEGEGEGEGQVTNDDFVFTRTFPGGDAYIPGSQIQVTIDLSYNGVDSLTALGLTEILPDGWTYAGIAGGDSPPVRPAIGSAGELAFAWLVPPDLPLSFTYRAAAPGDASGPQSFTGFARFRTTGDEQRSPSDLDTLSGVAQPDLSVVQFTTPNALYVGRAVKLHWEGLNRGLVPATSDWTDCVYLANAPDAVGGLPLSCLARSSDVDVAYSYEGNATVTIPSVAPGQYYLILSLDDESALGEMREDNNRRAIGPLPLVAIDYDATVSTATTTVPTGTAVTLSGTANHLGNAAPEPNAPVAIDVTLRGATTTLLTTSDGAGNFSTTFTPRTGAAGTYSISARHPGNAKQAAEDTFVAVGILLRAEATGITVGGNGSQTIPVSLKNPGNTTLTGISIGSPNSGIGVVSTLPHNARPRRQRHRHGHDYGGRRGLCRSLHPYRKQRGGCAVFQNPDPHPPERTANIVGARPNYGQCGPGTTNPRHL